MIPRPSRHSPAGLSAAGRLWNGLLAGVIVVAVTVQLAMAVRGGDGDAAFAAGDPSALTRVIRFFSYFTIQSNMLVLITCVWLVLDPMPFS